MIYDSLLIFAVLFFASAVALLLNQGEPMKAPWSTIYLLLVLYTYYAWFWQKSGQTLGMRAWKIRIVSETGGNPGWLACYGRLVCASFSLLCFGTGYLWRLFRPYTWHDRFSHTRIVRLAAPDKA